MKRSTLFRSAPLLTAALLMVLGATGRVRATDPPDPDLTGDWYGSVTNDRDPQSRGNAAMLVDAQEGSRFRGKLAIGRFVFDFKGSVGTDPPEPDRGETDPPDPDYQLFIEGSEPPNPDRGETDPPDPDMPVAMIMLIGTIGNPEIGNPEIGDPTIGDPTIGDPTIGDPTIGDPTGRWIITADYLLIFADGSREFGSLELVQKSGK